MLQSSLTAWLKKPAAVSRTSQETRHTDDTTIAPQDNEPSLKQLPTPLQSTPEHAVDTAWKKTSRLQDSVPPPTFHNLSTLPPLPPNVTLRKASKEDIKPLKQLNALLLQIPYPESFYREIIQDPLTNNLTLLAFWHDDPSSKDSEKGRLVGAIRCRLLAHPPGHAAEKQREGPTLYLSTLTLLSPFRGHGIAAHLLYSLTLFAIKTHSITSVAAHVWEANALGLEWYRRRGFTEWSREERYYPRLTPSGTVVMGRWVGLRDWQSALQWPLAPHKIVAPEVETGTR